MIKGCDIAFAQASASKLRYKLGLAPGPARPITWLETFTPDGATAPADYRMNRNPRGQAARCY